MFRKMAWKKKLFIIYCSLSCICLLLFFGVCSKSALSYAGAITRFAAERAFSQMEDYIEFRMDNLIQENYSLVYNNVVETALTRESTSVAKQLQDMNDIWTLFSQRLGEQSDQISSISLYLGENSIDSSLAKSQIEFRNFEEAKESRWYPVMIKQGLRTLCCGGEYTGDDNIIAVVHTISSAVNYSEIVGAVILKIPESTITDILRDGSTTEHAYSYILDSFGQVLCCSDENCGQSGLPEMEAVEEAVRSGKESAWADNLIRAARISYTGWTLVQVTPESDVLVLMTGYVRSLVLSLLIFIIVCIFVTSFISSLLTKRIVLLSNSMRNYKLALQNPPAYISDGDDIDHLIESYNTMMREINELARKNLETGKKLSETELALLYSQINPHFLFNTLDVLHWMIIKKEDEKAEQAVNNLIRFYKISLSDGKAVISLAEELVHVRSYVEIQNLRFSQTIRLEVEVEEELKAVLLPRITLQPIVENSVLHGIRGKLNQEGVIRISAFRRGEDAVITVWDNGVGISPENLMQLYSRKIGYGMKNINERIRLQFGDRYGLTIDSVVNEFTQIRITVPYQTEEEQG